MKRLIASLLLLGACQAGAWQVLSQHPIDLDGDGRDEIVGLRPYEKDKTRYGQLVVMGSGGAPVWEAPKGDPFEFLGPLDYGTIEAVGDLDNDGKIEMLGSYQKGDVSPTKHRLFRWDGKKFVHLKSGYLTAASAAGPFTWSEDVGATLWIDKFTGFRSPRLKGKLFSADGKTTGEHWFKMQRSGEVVVAD